VRCTDKCYAALQPLINLFRKSMVSNPKKKKPYYKTCNIPKILHIVTDSSISSRNPAYCPKILQIIPTSTTVQCSLLGVGGQTTGQVPKRYYWYVLQDMQHIPKSRILSQISCRLSQKVSRCNTPF